MRYAPKRRSSVVNMPAPDFTLHDHTGGQVRLHDSIRVAPAMLVFYPKDFTPVCTKQLCDYREHMQGFDEYGLQLFGISKNDGDSHRKFADEHKFPFLLLSDPGNKVARLYGCTSLLMLGNVSRAIFIVNTEGLILYRYVEPTVLTHRKSDALIKVLEQLKEDKLL